MKTVGRKGTHLAAAALLGLGLSTAARGAEPKPATGAAVDETRVEVLLHVSPEGDDANPGTEAAPLGSFTTAMQRALEHKSQGVGVKVLLHDGVYRESIGGDERGMSGMSPEPDTDAPLVIEAVNPGQAILSGSEIRTGWTRDGEVWVADWPHRMGAGEHFQGPPRPPAVFERHLVFVDGVMLRQVMARNEMRAGTFFIDEEMTSSVYVRPSTPTDLNEAKVETAVRQKMLFLRNIRNVVVRGLVFEHCNQPGGRLSRARGGWGAPLFFLESRNILVEDCLIRHNSSSGMKLHTVEDVTVRNTKIEWSGRQGLGMNHSRNALFEDLEITRSNFRGYWIDHIDGWSSTAFKFMFTRQTTMRRAHIHNNWASGLWWDIDNHDILVEDCVSINNHHRAIFIELNQGPTLIRNSVFAFTETTGGWREGGGGYRGGVLIATSADVTVENCIIYGNGYSQVNFWDQTDRFESGRIRNHDTEEPLNHGFQVAFRNNFIGSPVPGQPLFASAYGADDEGRRSAEEFVEIVGMSGNVFSHPNPDGAFLLSRQGTPMSLAQWQEAMGVEDPQARWTDPRAEDLERVLPRGISAQKVRELAEAVDQGALKSRRISLVAQPDAPSADRRIRVVAIDATYGYRPDGNDPAAAIDGDMDTVFNARGPDGRVALTLDLGARHRVAELMLAFGHDRVYRFDILGANAPDGDWVKIASGRSDGQARSWVRVPLAADRAWRYVRVQGLGNESRNMGDWFNVSEIVLIGE